MAERMTLRSCCALLFSAAAMLGFGAAPAQACDASNQNVFGISPGCIDLRISGPPTATNLAPDFFQAAGHPYEVVSVFRMNAPAALNSEGREYWPPEPLRDMRFDLPPGLAADLASVPTCSLDQLEAGGTGGPPTCPSDSQVGVVGVDLAVFGFAHWEVPIYVVEPPAGVPARFGFSTAGLANVLDAELGPGGELSMHASRMSQFLSFAGLKVVLWGVPADPAHDPQRACPGLSPPTQALGEVGPSCPAEVSPRAFLRLPSSCAKPATMLAQVSSWVHPEDFRSSSVVLHRSPGLLGDPAAPGSYPAPYPGLSSDQWGPPQGFTNCGQVPFAPSMTVRPGSQAADSPTGLDIQMSFPQTGFSDPDAISEADLESGTFTLPAGLSLNPGVANGLTACTPAEVDLESSSEAKCPNSSKLGTVELSTPVLSEPLVGSIYSAKLDASDPKQTTLPTYIVAGSGGLTLKLVSQLGIGSGDGRMTASFDHIPEVPISRLSFHFFGGERGPFVTPVVCGRYVADGRFVPRSGTGAVGLSDAFEITSGTDGGPCLSSPRDRPFNLGFKAGGSNPFAGAQTNVSVKLTRRDGEQEPKSFEVALPPGLSAALGDVAACSDAAIASAGGREGAAEAASPSCPAASRIGDVSAAIGAGDEPFYLQGGKTYLAGPYQGAPLSFALILPAVAGPMDLGTLAMRLPLKLDPSDGHLTLAGELPALVNGVRLNLKQLTIDVNRPNFLTNPTSCRASAVNGRIDGDAGATMRVSSPFQVQRCDLLGFQPRLRMKILGGRSATRHRAHPGLRSVLSTRRGDANLERSTIQLPGSAQLDPTHLRGVCMRVQFLADACPKGSTYGRVEVSSRLFPEPLAGLVYMRQSKSKLPSLVAALRGKIDLDLEMKLGFTDGRMRLDIDSLPDIPVSKLTLTTFGGRRGLFVNNRNLCEAPSFATAEMVGQNDKIAKRQAKLGVSCGASAPGIVTRSDDSRRR